MDAVGAISHLKLYNERAIKLKESSFLKSVQESNVTLRLLGNPFRVVREGGAGQEVMEAFVLSLRLFMQDRDGLSFRKIEDLYNSVPVGPQLKNEITEIRTSLSVYLDGSSPLVINDKAISRRELLTVWLNGEIAHVNREHRARLKSWSVDEDIRAFFQFEFETVITTVAWAVDAVREVNERALLELGGPNTRSS